MLYLKKPIRGTIKSKRQHNKKRIFFIDTHMHNMQLSGFSFYVKLF